MPIKFKKQIAKNQKEPCISPHEPITNEEMEKVQEEYRKSDHYKFKYKNKKS